MFLFANSFEYWILKTCAFFGVIPYLMGAYIVLDKAAKILSCPVYRYKRWMWFILRSKKAVYSDRDGKELFLVGVFRLDNWEDTEDRRYLMENNSVAIIFPFLRSVAQITFNSGYPSYLMPLMNIVEMLKKPKLRKRKRSNIYALYVF